MINQKKSLRLVIYNLLKQGFSPSAICERLNINKKTLQNHLTTLKQSRFIHKIGYGTWEILREYNEKEVFKDTLGSSNTLLIKAKPDSVRGHAFQFKIKLPKNMRNWKKREQFLLKNNIKFNELKGIMGKYGQKIEFKGRKIWLTDHSIIIYERASYMADTAKESKSYALADCRTLANALSKLLRANFSIGMRLWLKPCRQHYSLVKNALAIQYNREGTKLAVKDEKGYWLSIDNSLNMHEVETLHPNTSDIDNKKVQDFFNGIKAYEDFTPQTIMKIFGEQKYVNETLFKLEAMTMENVKNHLNVIEEIKQLIKTLNEKFKNNRNIYK